MGKLTMGEYNSFLKVTQIVRGSGMQSSKKWHSSMQAQAQDCECGLQSRAPVGGHVLEQMELDKW